MRLERDLMKTEKYYKLVDSFSELDIEDKKEEVLKHTLELLQLLYLKNKEFDKEAEVLPVLNKYRDEEEYFNLLFSYIISLKEENAKLIDKLDRKSTRLNSSHP